MFKIETTFAAEDCMTPEFAEKIVDITERYHSQLSLQCADRCLRLDSLICVLALDLYRGVKVAVIAEGEDERLAAHEMSRVLEGHK